MASAMLVLCGVATLAGPNGTAPAIENGRRVRNPPPFPTGTELNLSRETGGPERTPFTWTPKAMRCAAAEARTAHMHTAPQAGYRFPVCEPRRRNFGGGQTRGPPATALVQWWQTTRGSTTAMLAALGEEADEPEADEPREVAFKQLGVFRARGRVVAQSAEH